MSHLSCRLKGMNVVYMEGDILLCQSAMIMQGGKGFIRAILSASTGVAQEFQYQAIPY